MSAVWPWVSVVVLAIATQIEARRHGRYMYTLALRHVEEDIARARHRGEELEVFEVTSKLRKEVRRG